MPLSAETPQGNLSTETPSNFFNSAYMDIESYFDFPASDSKAAQDPSFRSPRLTPSISPSLNTHFRPSPGVVWSGVRDSPGPPGFQSYATNNNNVSVTMSDSQSATVIAPLQTTNSFAGQPSPPNSSGSSPGKYAPPGDISPLDSLISHMPTDAASRRVHGQVTPPDDAAKSPTFSHASPSLVFSMHLTPPEGSPELSPRTTSFPNRKRRERSISEEAKPSREGGASSDGTGNGNKRRRSSTGAQPGGGGNGGGRKSRKSVSAEEPLEVQEAKRRRFLERNRVAASKCRQKKKAWMQDLETEAREAQNMSKQLKACVGMLKEEILQLKSELLKHNTCDCVPIRQYLSNEAMRLAECGGGGGGGSSSSSATATGSARPSNASEFSYAAAADETVDSIITPLLSGAEFNLDFVDSAETGMN